MTVKMGVKADESKTGSDNVPAVESLKCRKRGILTKLGGDKRGLTL